MQTKLLLALGTVAWLAMANSALAEEVGTTDNNALEGTPADASSSNDDVTPTSPLGESGVEYRRNDHSPSDRTGRSDRSGRGASGSDGGEGGGSDSGGDSGGGDVD